MKVLVSEQLGPHKYKDNHGYLICTDCIMARTGKQTYTRDDCFGDGDQTEIEVDRPEKEVFDPKTLASFENVPITIEHPSSNVDPDNYNSLSVGYMRDIHKGTYEGKPVMMGTAVITDAEGIEKVESGELTNLSCGYDCDVDDSEHPTQMNIRGNHIALCEIPRAGITHIQDSLNVKKKQFVDTLKENKIPYQEKKGNRFVFLEDDIGLAKKLARRIVGDYYLEDNDTLAIDFRNKKENIMNHDQNYSAEDGLKKNKKGWEVKTNKKNSKYHGTFKTKKKANKQLRAMWSNNPAYLKTKGKQDSDDNDYVIWHLLPDNESIKIDVVEDSLNDVISDFKMNNWKYDYRVSSYQKDVLKEGQILKPEGLPSKDTEYSVFYDNLLSNEYDNFYDSFVKSHVGDAEESKDEKRCVICGKKIKGRSKDASPFSTGRCCEDCYKKYVHPSQRMEDKYSSKKKDSVTYIVKANSYQDALRKVKKLTTKDSKESALEYLEGMLGIELNYDDLGVKVTEEIGGDPIPDDRHGGDYIKYSPAETKSGVINDWVYIIDLPEDPDKILKLIAKYVEKPVSEVTEEDILSVFDEPIDLETSYITDDFIDFLKEYCRKDAEKDALENHDDDQVDWNDDEEYLDPYDEME